VSVQLRLVSPPLPPPCDGDERFAAAVVTHEATLTAIALKLCRNRPDALDLVQDTFERALRAWDRLPLDANVQAWLVTILHRRFIDRCRRARRARLADATADRRVPVTPEPAVMSVWSGVTPEQVAAALATLDDEFRRAYVLYVVEGRTYQQIAEQLAIPRSTVGTRLLRARRKLRELLIGRDEPGEGAS
jgi:RNA polymerase sigma-70 factor, ECF subfamily